MLCGVGVSTTVVVTPVQWRNTGFVQVWFFVLACRVGVSTTVVVTPVQWRNTGFVQVQFFIPAHICVVQGWGIHGWWGKPGTMKEYWYFTGSFLCQHTSVLCRVAVPVTVEVL